MRRVTMIGLGAGLLVVLTAGCARLPLGQLPILVSDSSAQWIRRATAPSPWPHRAGEQWTYFAREFELTERPATLRIRIRALRRARVSLNGNDVGSRTPRAVPWRNAEELKLAPLLHRGTNRLVIAVENPDGPPALQLSSPDFDLATGTGWQVATEARLYEPAVPAAERGFFALSRAFPTPFDAAARRWPLAFTLFAAGLAGALALAASGRRIHPGHARLLVMAAWVALFANNLPRLPLAVGFDVAGHYAYIAHIVSRHALPLATDGWEMYQSPLFYLIAAPPYAWLSSWFTPETARLALRVIPMLCGLAQIELAFRGARLLFPARPDLHAAGALLAGFVPMHVYGSHTVSNEQLAALLIAWAVYRCLGLLVREPGRSILFESVALGGLFGLAILAKVTAFLLLPLLLGAIALAARIRERELRGTAAALLGFCGTAAAVGGWYYLRNWVALGRPFVGGWDASRGFAHWQDPGYRMTSDYLSFGSALEHAIFPSVSSLWDSLYASLTGDAWLSGMATSAAAPPWSFDFVVAMSWLSLPVVLLGAAGAVRVLTPGGGAQRRGLRFALLVVAAYWSAVVFLWTIAPGYASGKATYTLGALGSYVALVLAGIEPLTRGRSRRLGWAVTAGYLCAWAGFSFWGYLIR